MMVCDSYKEYIRMCRDANILQGILINMVKNNMFFFMLPGGHAFKQGF